MAKLSLSRYERHIKVSDVLSRQVGQLTRLVDDLLDISRIRHDKIEIRSARVNLVDILAEAADMSRPLIELRKHVFTIVLPETPLYVDGDRTRLLQIFFNLLNNAAKYTLYGGKIRLCLRQEKGQAVIDIKDNGLGLSPDVLPLIFERYSQCQYSIDHAQGGLGLGLTLVKDLVQRHQGRVEAKSEGLNKGSTFSVYLPLAHKQEEEKKMTAVSETPVPAVQRHLKVLVIDDSEASAKTMSWVLEMMGHHAEYACDSAKALQMAKQISPDVIMMDIGMPDMNGYDLCRILRELPEMKNTTFIAQTGWTQPKYQNLSAEAGFKHHLVKPIPDNILRDVLNTI